MQTTEEKLLWIAQLAIASDAAIEANLGFVGTANMDDVDPSVSDEMEMSGFGFKTLVAPTGERVFGMDRSMNEDVQRILGFDLSPAQDNGSQDDHVSFTCTMRPTNLFGPAICSALATNWDICFGFDRQSERIDEGAITLLAYGLLTNAWVKPKGDTIDETKLDEALNDAVVRVQLLVGKCTERGDYSPFKEIIAAWQGG